MMRWFSRPLALSLLALAAAGILLTQSMVWLTVQLRHGGTVDITGAAGTTGVSALALVLLALVGALALTRGAVRVILLVLGGIVGMALSVSIGSTLVSPDVAVRAVTESTGVRVEPAELLSVTWTAAGGLAGAFAVLGTLVAVLSLWQVTHWSATSHKYEPRDTTGAEPDTSQSWDALSRGEDPTESR